MSRVPFQEIEKLAVKKISIDRSFESPAIRAARDKVWVIEDKLAKFPQYGNGRNGLKSDLERARR